jgi:uncharacterized protein (AIM24 family)
MELAPAASVVIYICGYAAGMNDRPFLLPVTASIRRPSDIMTQGMLAKAVLDVLVRGNPSRALVALDVVPVPDAPLGPAKPVRPVSPALMAEDTPMPGPSETARFQVGDTLPPGTKLRAASPAPPAIPGAPPAVAREVFRGLEKGLMEVEFSGKVFIKQGTIYSYSGNLNFWVKDMRPGLRPPLVIVTGTGRLILTDLERQITFMQVADEPVFVEPAHLLACEESLQPRYTRLGEEGSGLEIVALEGRGMVALSVASKPLPLTVRPGQPVSVPASSVIMWTGELTPQVVNDPRVYAVVLASASAPGRILRLEGTGRILVEQAAG